MFKNTSQMLGLGQKLERNTTFSSPDKYKHNGNDWHMFKNLSNTLLVQVRTRKHTVKMTGPCPFWDPKKYLELPERFLAPNDPPGAGFPGSSWALMFLRNLGFGVGSTLGPFWAILDH